jgi:uroporphyrinogen decarboxylase
MLIDLALNPEFAEALFWKVGEIFKGFYQAQLDAVGDYIEWVEIGDDLGGQNGPLISPKMYRELLKPIHADVIKSIKEHPSNPKVMYHSCGSIKVFIPDFIELGVDILNPIQVAAKGIVPSEIKKEFGNELCFLGGVDSQHLMPTGTPQQVSEQVKRRIQEMGVGGGYVLAPSHNIGDDVPLENILAFFEGANDFGTYPILLD